jgi:hypothetical protein
MSIGKTMTIRISKRTKIALDLFAAKQVLKIGRNLTNDEAIVKLLDEADPDLMERAERLEQEQSEANEE